MTDTPSTERLEEMLAEYWQLAFNEGQQGRTTDTPDGEKDGGDQYVPKIIEYEGEGEPYVEFVSADVPTVTREGLSGELLLAMDRSKVVGLRVYTKSTRTNDTTPVGGVRVTDEMVERAAKALYEEDDAWSAALPWPTANEADAYRRLARAALQAAITSTPVEPVTDEEQEPPSLDDAYRAAYQAVEVFYDVASLEETMWTGWGDQIVPIYAEVRRVKAKQSLNALRDADMTRFKALHPQLGGEK